MRRSLISKILQSATRVAGQPVTAISTTSTTASAIPDIIRETDQLVATSRYGAALEVIERASAGGRHKCDLQVARARILHHWGRHAEARSELLEAESSNAAACDDQFYRVLGIASLWAGDAPGAERCMRRALEQLPDHWEYLFGLGMALYGQQRYDEARAAYEQALTAKPDDVHCLGNLISCHLDLDDLESAERLARRMVDAHPDNFVSWSNLCVVLDRQARYDEAITAFERATEAASAGGHYPENDFLNHAICLLRASRTDEAIQLLESRLTVDPLVQAHCHYALALLHSGRMKDGWDQFEFRWMDGPLKTLRPNFVKPVWAGQDLSGKTILLRAEQGSGDFFHFIRYAPYVKALGATVLLMLPEIVRNIAHTVEGIDRILKPDEPYPHFDFYIELMSLPRVFRTELSSAPCRIPYIKTDSARVAQWATRLANGSFNVGIAWAGSPTHLRDKDRSISLRVLEPLSELRGVSFYSLQKGPAAAELRAGACAGWVEDLEAELPDFVDTSALIEALDLVICVDTSVAHLAGALGKPAWVMLAKFSDWRWLAKGQETPWYPSMRLFRQAERGDWEAVVRSVRTALQEVLDGQAKVTAVHNCERDESPTLIPRTPDLPDRRLSAATRVRNAFLQYLPSQETVARCLTFYGEYLQQQLDLLARIVAPNATLVEVGSGIGVHAVFLGGTVARDGNIYLYEHRRAVRKILEQNLASNDIANVTIMKMIAEGSLSIEGGSSESGRDASQAIERIDDLRLGRLHLLKTFENCEPARVIEGASDTLWRLRPHVFCAVRDAFHAAALSQQLKELSYRSWRMEIPLFNPDNFNLRSDDVLSGRSAFALLAVPEEIDMDIVLPYCVEIQ